VSLRLESTASQYSVVVSNKEPSAQLACFAVVLRLLVALELAANKLLASLQAASILAVQLLV
jgi:hypothetical protein